ncbi:hypothetical protein Tco_0184053 [Tanacetum coccineum]
MKTSFRSLKKSVVNITNTSTNKAFQVPIDPSRAQLPFNSRDELFAPCHVLLSPESRIHTCIEPLDLEFLDSVIQKKEAIHLDIVELEMKIFSTGDACRTAQEMWEPSKGYNRFGVDIQNTKCFVRDLQGNDLLTGNRGTDLYTISLQETTSSTPICSWLKGITIINVVMASKDFLYLNFDYINCFQRKML